jgi:hypothetical protein
VPRGVVTGQPRVLVAGGGSEELEEAARGFKNDSKNASAT